MIPTVGLKLYPNPAVSIPTGPRTPVDTIAVAMATDVGLPPLKVMDGGVVYPVPGLFSRILSIDLLGTPVLHSRILFL